MVSVYFFQINQIPKDEVILDQLEEQGIFFSYFQVDQKYYLFLFNKEVIEIDFLDATAHFIEELDSKQRKIRSLRGFLLYALEIMENGEDSKILSTNLSPFFWKKVKTTIRQNKKGALEEFLFGSQLKQSIHDASFQENFDEKIRTLQNQVHSLQDTVIRLEKSFEKYVRIGQNNASEVIKSATKVKVSNSRQYHESLESS